MPSNGRRRHNARRTVPQMRGKRRVKSFLGPVHEVGPGGAMHVQVDITRNDVAIVINAFDGGFSASCNYIRRSNINDAAVSHEHGPVRKHPIR
ncbi:MAG TPA: hypothetical protein VJ809_06575 [Pirellulales bacterium]|jgi:hypothetical protein|nr:hypothetical protein [Pirellulales bacterium]